MAHMLRWVDFITFRQGPEFGVPEVVYNNLRRVSVRREGVEGTTVRIKIDLYVGGITLIFSRDRRQSPRET